jgi:glycosyltransferase involved in cell wall biosynthesis
MRREVTDLQHFDIGLMPLDDDVWTRGKAGLKIVTYLACGVPCVASPVGFSPVVLGPAGLCGLYASDAEQWYAALEQMLSDAPARRAMGRRGRTRMIERFDVQRHSTSWVRVLEEVAAA